MFPAVSYDYLQIIEAPAQDRRTPYSVEVRRFARRGFLSLMIMLAGDQFPNRYCPFIYAVPLHHVLCPSGRVGGCYQGRSGWLPKLDSRRIDQLHD